MEKHSPLLHFLDQIRDEAHRFAVTYHKRLRGKETVRSELGEIPGIGETKEKELLKHFGSVERIKEATAEELAKAPGINPKLVQRVHDYFHRSDSSD